ncbi:MAG: diguanylate cyclase [Candidatus Desulforudis sp.]|nr:diguanylate cyclase [Desulforudis sp.]
MIGITLAFTLFLHLHETLFPDPTIPLYWFMCVGFAALISTVFLFSFRRVLLTNLKRERDFLRTEERFRQLIENGQDVIFRFRIKPNHHWEYVSPAVTAITGYSPEEFYNDPTLHLRIVHPDDIKLVTGISQSLVSRNEPFLVRYVRKDGGIVWAEQNIVPVFNEAGEIVALESIARNITERKQAEEQLRFLSLHDSLTGVYNRSYFEEEMRRLAGGRYTPVGLIVCDLDALKFVNDTLGHAVGDLLLKKAAELIQSCFRTNDVVARIGGDEFAAILPRSDAVSVEEACNRIRISIADYNQTNPELPVSLSVGFAVSSGDTVGVNELFREADNNMYRDKLLRSESTHSVTLQILTKALKEKDFLAEGHAEHMEDLVVALGQRIGLAQQGITELRLLAQFHDIGKVAIPDHVLFKPASLSPEEKMEVQRHSEIGYRIAQSLPSLVMIADLILKHHEWWNGQGYPLGLAGEAIPVEARILAIVDAYEAITNNRPHRRAMTGAEALSELKNCSGTQFDPELTWAFCDVIANRGRHQQELLLKPT